MSIGKVKAANVDAERLDKLVTRWWELAGVGYPRERTNQVGWAEHLERLAAEHEKRDGESNNDPAPGSHPPSPQNRERQMAQGSADAEGLAPFLALLSQPQ
jgi:hypothetical protein